MPSETKRKVYNKKGMVSLPAPFRNYHKIEKGNELKCLSNGIVVFLPPDIDEEKEEKVRKMLEEV